MKIKIQLMMKNLKERFSKLNVYLKFTIIFLIIMLIGFLPIEIKNGSFLFSGFFGALDGGIDGLKQHSLFMYDFIKHIKEGLFNSGIELFRFDIGLGSDFINHYTYYSLFDPLMIIAYIIPLKHIELSYYILIMLRIYLCGIFIIILGKKLNIKKDSSLLALGLFYTFNVALLYSALRHPMFTNGPMYFALVLLGYEKIKSGESPVVFIISVFLAMISQFYIFTYLTFGYGLFTLVELLKGKKLKQFIKVNLYYLLAMGLGGFVLLTQMNATFSGARVGSKGFILYHAIDYFTLITANFIPLAGDHYIIGIGNFIVFIICLYYVINEKKKNSYSMLFIILFILSFFASFSYLINLTSYVVNRWLFLIILPASIIVGKFLEEKKDINEESLFKVNKIFYILIVLALVSIIIFGFKFLFNNYLIRLIISIVIAIVGFVLIYFIYRLKAKKIIFKNLLISPKLYKYVIYNALISLLIVSGIYLFILTPNNAFNTYYGASDDYSEALAGDGFFRVEQNTFIAGIDEFSNDGIFYGYPSTASYNTMTNGNIINMIAEYNINNSNNSVGYNGFNNRARFLAINHVKYVIIRESDKITPPASFSKYKSISVPKYDDSKKIFAQGGNILRDADGEIIYEDAYIYLNNRFLDFGIFFDSYLTSEDIKNLNSVEKELLLTKTIILADSYLNSEKYIINEYNNKIQVREFLLDNLEIVDNKIIAGKNNSLSFIIPKVMNEELYIEVSGLANENYQKSFTTHYYTNKYTQNVRNYGYGSNMYLEHKDHLVNLGYYNEEIDLLVMIKFEEGIYEFENIGYYLLSDSELENDLDRLNNNLLTELVFENSGFSGNINSSKSGFLLLSIPYSKGFKAYLKGEEVKILRANTGYMAIPISEGNYKLEVKYITPGLEFGLYLSIISLVIFVFIIRKSILDKTKISHQTNKKEEENEKSRTIY